MHRRLAARGRRIANAGLRVETLEAQRQQFRLQFALLFLQDLVAARGGGLALQVADLLLHFLAQIVQAVQILARLGDAAFGFAAPLLVARNARGLLQESPQVVRAAPR